MDPSTRDDEILTKILVARMLEALTDEQRDIIVLWMEGNFTLEDIGRIVGQKYYGKDLSDSVIRYHRNKIFKQLNKEFEGK